MLRSRFLVLCFVLVFVVVYAVDCAHSAPPTGKEGKVKTALVPQTGQTTSYATGDDGDLQMGVPLPVPRFTDHGDGTATDRLTGLMWLTNVGDDVSWDVALDFCNSLTYARHSDWRLPSIKELYSLSDYGRVGYCQYYSEVYNCSLPADHPFTNLHCFEWLWSSTVMNTTWRCNAGDCVYHFQVEEAIIHYTPWKTGDWVMPFLCVRGGS